MSARAGAMTRPSWWLFTSKTRSAGYQHMHWPPTSKTRLASARDWCPCTLSRIQNVSSVKSSKSPDVFFLAATPVSVTSVLSCWKTDALYVGHSSAPTFPLGLTHLLWRRGTPWHNLRRRLRMPEGHQITQPTLSEESQEHLFGSRNKRQSRW